MAVRAMEMVEMAFWKKKLSKPKHFKLAIVHIRK